MLRIWLFGLLMSFHLNAAQADESKPPGMSDSVSRDMDKTQVFVQTAMPGVSDNITVSRDGRYMLSASTSELALWDLYSGRQIRNLVGHASLVKSADFSPDGKYAASSSLDGTWRLWDLTSGKTVRSVKVFDGGKYKQGMIYSVSFSPDGSQLLTAGLGGTMEDLTHSVKIWDVSTGQLIRAMSDTTSDSANLAAFSPDGKTVMSAHGVMKSSLKLWDISSGRLLKSFPLSGNAHHAFAMSPDGKSVLSWKIGTKTPDITLWGIDSGQIARKFADVVPNMPVANAKISPDGLSVIVSGYGATEIVETTSGRVTHRLSMSTYPYFDRQGLRLLKLGGIVQLLDGESRKLITSFRWGANVFLVSPTFSQDGRKLVQGWNTWDMATGKASAYKKNKNYWISGGIYSHVSNQRLEGSGSTLSLINAEDGEVVRQLKGPATSSAVPAAFSSDGRLALSIGTIILGTNKTDSTIRIWDVSTGENVRTLDASAYGQVAYADLSPDGKFVIASHSQAASMAFSDARSPGIKLWEVETGKDLETLKDGVGTGKVIFSPDGRYALSAPGSFEEGKPFHLYDLKATGQKVQTFAGHENTVVSVAFSADGKRVISGSLDNTARVWDVVTGNQLHVLKGHPGLVTSVAFSPDGHRIVTSTSSESRLWDASSGKQLLQLVAFPDGGWIAITPDGYFTASSPKAAESLNVRIGITVYGIDQFYDVFYRPDIVEATLAGKDTSSLIALTINQAVRNSPPVVEKIDAPASNGADAVKFTYRIKSNGGGIGDVRVFHNGKLVKSDGVVRPIPDTLLGKKTTQVTGEVLVAQMRTLAVQAVKDESLRGAVVSTSKPDLYESAVEIEPVPGENDISVVAFNAQNSIQSVARTTQFISTKPPVAPRLHILTIGVDEYKDKSASLAFAVKDSRDIAVRWKAQAANIYGAQNIFVETISNAQAGREGILAKVNQMAARVKPTDHFVLFIASHGVLLGDQYYMVTSDYDGKLNPSKLIGANEIVDASKRIKALSQLYILDTCHAGGMGGVVSGLYDARVSVLAKKMGLHIFASASSSEEAIDGFEGNGLFTHTLLAGLNNNKVLDSNSDKKVSLIELGTFSKAQTRDIAKKQNHKQDPLIINFGQDNPVYLLQ